MAKENTPKPPSTVYLILSGVVALFLLWRIFASSEPASPTLLTMQWVFLILILIFLGYSIFSRKQ